MNQRNRTPDMSTYEAYLEARDLAEQLLQVLRQLLAYHCTWHTLQYEGILVDFYRVETTLNRLTKMVNKLTA